MEIERGDRYVRGKKREIVYWTDRKCSSEMC